MKASDKEVGKLLSAAEKAGWTVKDKRNGWMLLSPDGRYAVMLHGSNSDYRALKNAKINAQVCWAQGLGKEINVGIGTMMDSKAVADYLGVKVDSLHRMRQRKGFMPNPDGYISGAPWWWSTTIKVWDKNRPSAGHPRTAKKDLTASS